MPRYVGPPSSRNLGLASPECALDDLAHVKAESVIALLATFIANRARRIAGEKRKAKPNAKLIAKWEAENREAVQYHRVLNTRDSELVSKVEKRFTDLLAQGD